MKELIRKAINSNLVKTSFFNGIANFIKIISSIISSKITAVYLGPAGIALLGQFINISSILMSFSTLGINTGITKYTAEYHDSPQKQKETLSTGFLLTLLGSLIVSTYVFIERGDLSIRFLHTDQYASVFGILSLTLILFALNSYFTSVLNGNKEFKKIIIVNIAGSILGLIISLLLIIRYGVGGAFLAIIFSQTLVFFTTLLFVVKSKWFSINNFLSGIKPESIKILSKFSLMAFTSVFAITFIQLQIRNFIMHSISIESAGYWQGVTRISDLYLSFITSTLSIYYLPRLSEIKDQFELKKEILKGYSFILPLTIVSAGTIFLLREWIVRIFLAKTFLPMTPLFAMQLVGDVFKIASWLLAYLLIAKAMTKVFIITELLFGISLYILTRLFVTKMGVIGATYAFALNYFIYFFVMIFIFKDIVLARKIKSGVSSEVIYGKTGNGIGSDTVYNQEKYIIDTITSVLNQKTNFDFEIVVGDDNSRDKSPVILANLEKKYPGTIKVIHNKKNLGLLLNIKNIYDNCQGKYIAVLGGDDLFSDKYKLQKQYDFLEKNQDYGLVYSDAKLLIEMPNKENQLLESVNIHYKRKPKSGYVYEDCLLKFFIIASTVVFRKQLYHQYVDYKSLSDIGIKAEDFPLYIELSRISKFGYINEPLSTYRMGINSTSRPANKNKYYSFYESCVKGRLYFLDKYGASDQSKKFIIGKAHLFYLFYAFHLGDVRLAKESLNYFVENKEASFLLYLYYWGCRFLPFRILLKILLRFFRGARLNYYF